MCLGRLESLSIDLDMANCIQFRIGGKMCKNKTFLFLFLFFTELNFTSLDKVGYLEGSDVWVLAPLSIIVDYSVDWTMTFA